MAFLEKHFSTFLGTNFSMEESLGNTNFQGLIKNKK